MRSVTGRPSSSGTSIVVAEALLQLPDGRVLLAERRDRVAGLAGSSSQGLAFSSGDSACGAAELEAAAVDQRVRHAEDPRPGRLVEVQAAGVVAGPDAEREDRHCLRTSGEPASSSASSSSGDLPASWYAFWSDRSTSVSVPSARSGPGRPASRSRPEREPAAAAGLREEVAVRLAAERLDGDEQERRRRRAGRRSAGSASGCGRRCARRAARATPERPPGAAASSQVQTAASPAVSSSAPPPKNVPACGSPGGIDGADQRRTRWPRSRPSDRRSAAPSARGEPPADSSPRTP